MLKKLFAITILFISTSCFAQGISSIKNYFGKTQFTIIGNELKLNLNTEKYPLNNNQYFIFTYNFKKINAAKKIGFEGQSITIKKSELEEYKGKHIPIDSVDYLKIFYKSGTKTEYQTRIKLNFVNKEKLADDFALINLIYSNNNQSKEETERAMRDYFSDMFGKTEKNTLNSEINKILH